MLPRRTCIAALCGLLTAPAFAHDYTLGSLQIRHPWTRATPPSAPSGGGYMTIVNNGPAADRLVGVRSAIAGKSEIHEMVMDGNVMRMRELEGGLAIPAGATVQLKPGGYHVMLMELKGPLVRDAMVPVTLVFEKAGSIDVEFKVDAMGATASQHGH